MKTKNYSRNSKKLAMEKKPLIIALITLGSIGVLVLLLIFGPGMFAGKAIYTGGTINTAGIVKVSAVQNNKFTMTIGANIGSSNSMLYSFALNSDKILDNVLTCTGPVPIISATDKAKGCQVSDYAFAPGPTPYSYISYLLPPCSPITGETEIADITCTIKDLSLTSLQIGLEYFLPFDKTKLITNIVPGDKTSITIKSVTACTDGDLGLAPYNELCIKSKWVLCDTEKDTTIYGKYTCTSDKWVVTPTTCDSSTCSNSGSSICFNNKCINCDTLTEGKISDDYTYQCVDSDGYNEKCTTLGFGYDSTSLCDGTYYNKCGTTQTYLKGNENYYCDQSPTFKWELCDSAKKSTDGNYECKQTNSVWKWNKLALCIAGTKVCDGNTKTKTCKTDGSGYLTSVDCDTGTTCSSGVCVATPKCTGTAPTYGASTIVSSASPTQDTLWTFDKQTDGLTPCEWKCNDGYERVDGASNCVAKVQTEILTGCKTSGWEKGKTYNLTQDITTTGTCFEIDKEGITLDCRDFSITGSGSADFGIRINASGVSIKNCTISNFNPNGIYVRGESSNEIKDITFLNNKFKLNYYGISVDYVDKIKIQNNIAETSIGNGFFCGVDVTSISGNNNIFDSVTTCKDGWPFKDIMGFWGDKKVLSNEVCNNSIDDDGDGKIDCEDSDCVGFIGSDGKNNDVICTGFADPNHNLTCGIDTTYGEIKNIFNSPLQFDALCVKNTPYSTWYECNIDGIQEKKGNNGNVATNETVVDGKFICGNEFGGKLERWMECTSTGTKSISTNAGTTAKKGDIYGKYTCNGSLWLGDVGSTCQIDDDCLSGSCNSNTASCKSAVTLGDVNGGGITLADAVLALRHATGKSLLTGQKLLAADVVGCDGNVINSDAVLILRYANQKITNFPCDKK